MIIPTVFFSLMFLILIVCAVKIKSWAFALVAVSVLAVTIIANVWNNVGLFGLLGIHGLIPAITNTRNYIKNKNKDAEEKE